MEQKPATGQSAGRRPGPSALAEGLALRQRRCLKQAAACFEQAVIVGPSSVEGWFWLAVTRNNRGQEAGAIPAHREALSLGISEVNTRAQAWTWLASSVSKTGRHAEALGALAEADSIGGYEPAMSQRRSTRRSAAVFSAEHGVHSAKQPGRWAPRTRPAGRSGWPARRFSFRSRLAAVHRTKATIAVVRQVS